MTTHEGPTIVLDETTRRPLVQWMVDVALYAFHQGVEAQADGEDIHATCEAQFIEQRALAEAAKAKMEEMQISRDSYALQRNQARAEMQRWSGAYEAKRLEWAKSLEKWAGLIGCGLTADQPELFTLIDSALEQGVKDAARLAFVDAASVDEPGMPEFPESHVQTDLEWRFRVWGRKGWDAATGWKAEALKKFDSSAGEGLKRFLCNALALDESSTWMEIKNTAVALRAERDDLQGKLGDTLCWSDRLEADLARYESPEGEALDGPIRPGYISDHPMLKQVYDLCQAIEAIPIACPEETHAVTLAGALSKPIADLANQLVKARVALATWEEGCMCTEKNRQTKEQAREVGRIEGYRSALNDKTGGELAAILAPELALAREQEWDRCFNAVREWLDIHPVDNLEGPELDHAIRAAMTPKEDSRA